MGGNSPSKEKTKKVNTGDKGKTYQTAQIPVQMQGPPPGQPKVWMSTPTYYVGAPAPAYAYNTPKGSGPRLVPKQHLRVPNGVPKHRYASDSALHQNKPKPNHLARPGPVAKKDTPPNKGKKQAKTPLAIPLKDVLPPPPRYQEVQGKDIVLDKETIKGRSNAYLIEQHGFDKRKTATARVFSNYQQELSTSAANNVMHRSSPAVGGHSSGVAAAYSEYSDPSSHRRGEERTNNHVQSDWDVSYVPDQFGGYTRMSQEQQPNTGYKENAFVRNQYNHGVFIAQPLTDTESLGSDTVPPEQSKSNEEANTNRNIAHDPIYDRVISPAVEKPVRRSTSDVSHLRRSPKKEPIYAHVNKDLKRNSSQKQYDIDPVREVDYPPSPTTPPLPPHIGYQPGRRMSTKERTEDMVRKRREELHRETSMTSEAIVGEEVEDAFKFLEEFDDTSQLGT